MNRDSAPASPSDEELACRARQGCAESFEQLLRRFQTPVVRFLRRQGAAEDAEDLAQETFLRAFENLHRYNRRWSFSAWLFTIARRLGINQHRRVRPIADGAAVQLACAADAEPWQAIAAEEGRRRLWDVAAAVLSRDELTALWLHYVEEMPIAEIALVLGRSRAATKVMMFRAEKRCCLCWANSTAIVRPIATAANGRRRCGSRASRPGSRVMPRKDTHHEESVLRDRLRREALAMGPAFSESLHQRILGAVDRRRQQQAVGIGPRFWDAVLPKRADGRRSLRYLLAAAACLFVAVLIGWQSARERRGGDSDSPNVALAEPVARTALAEPVARTAQAEPVARTALAEPVARAELVARAALPATADVLPAKMPPIGELPNNAVEGFNGLVDSVVVAPQSEALAQDMQLAADSMLRCLPIDLALADDF